MSATAVQDKEKLREERAFQLAFGEAIKYTALGVTAVAAGTLFLTYTNPKFNKFTSISAKVSFPTMTGLFLFGFVFEKTALETKIHPEKYGLTDYVEKGIVTRSNMPYHHQALNHIYDHPFEMIAGLGSPLFGYILYTNLKLKHLTLSQKLMHTRVYTQGGVIAILLTTMLFRDYMNRAGRFPEPSED